MRDWRKTIGGVALSVSVITVATLLCSAAAFASTDSKSNSAITKQLPAHVDTKSAIKQNSQLSDKAKSEPLKKADGAKASPVKGQKVQYVPRLQCVTFARASSGIQIKGNATNWWDNATGVYSRGQAPEAGSVLNFRSTRGMRLGHVAVVTRIVSDREIEIDHANWAGPGASKGGVSRGMSVIDVSPDNSWTQVRVTLGGEGKYGSVYPTYGFIYDRPDNGTFALNTHSAAQPYDEVAEAPSHTLH